MKKISTTLKILLILGLCMLASACATPNTCWYNAGKNLHQTKTDKFQCEEAAVAYCNDMDKPGNAEMIDLRMKKCMSDVRGYQLTAESTLPKGSTCVK